MHKRFRDYNYKLRTRLGVSELRFGDWRLGIGD
jgi:hypothetical protein